MIAKYRKPEFPGEWWMTDFTAGQVEGRIAALEAEVERLTQERDATHENYKDEHQRCNLLRAEVERQLALLREWIVVGSNARTVSWTAIANLTRDSRAALGEGE